LREKKKRGKRGGNPTGHATGCGRWKRGGKKNEKERTLSILSEFYFMIEEKKKKRGEKRKKRGGGGGGAPLDRPEEKEESPSHLIRTSLRKEGGGKGEKGEKSLFLRLKKIQSQGGGRKREGRGKGGRRGKPRSIEDRSHLKGPLQRRRGKKKKKKKKKGRKGGKIFRALVPRCPRGGGEKKGKKKRTVEVWSPSCLQRANLLSVSQQGGKEKKKKEREKRKKEKKGKLTAVRPSCLGRKPSPLRKNGKKKKGKRKKKKKKKRRGGGKNELG